jgi:diaminopimelate epimerase
MRFSKLYAAGKDFLCLEAAEVRDRGVAGLCRALCDRHFGAGADGLLLFEFAEDGGTRLRHFGPCGEEKEAGPAAVACAAWFAHARRPAAAGRGIESGGRTRFASVEASQGKVARVRVGVGVPALQAGLIPTTLPGNPPVEVPVTFPDTMHNVTCLGLAGPHAVVFVRELTDAVAQTVGPQLARHPGFPRRASVAVVRVDRPGEATARFYDPDAGEVSASLAGAGAVAVAGGLSGRAPRTLVVRSRGGDLAADWSPADNHVYVTAAVREVYQGEWPDGTPH